MNNKPKSVSILITTYNWPKALKVVIESVLNQTYLPDEIIIADDGSGKETKDLVNKFIDESNANIIHVWHEDKGFRAGPIRNKAIAKATSEYIIQIDGDTIIERHFIEDHLSKSEHGKFIIGSRVLLNEKLSTEVLNGNKKTINFFSENIKNNFNTLRLPFISNFFSSPTKDIPKVIRSSHSCNMSSYRSDLIDVNGYNEEMIGWGREDSELAVRLVNNGLTKERIKLSGIQYHIHHKENDRSRFNINDQILESTVLDKKIQCQNGIFKDINLSARSKINITAIIPTFNEEKRLEKALQSVSFADEIIVVDSFSTDKTLEIAKKYDAKVVQHEYINPSAQKNWIIPQAKYDWILLVDADEWITSELKNEIVKLYNSGFTKDAYWIHRSNFFMGRRIKFSGWQNDKVVRLFNKKCRYNDKQVHEEIITESIDIGFLKNKMDHNTYTTMDNYIIKLNRYAQWQAEDYNDKVGRVSIHHLILKPTFRFLIHYIIKLGFLDGVPGFTISALQGYAVLMRYVKLWLLRRDMK